MKTEKIMNGFATLCFIGVIICGIGWLSDKMKDSDNLETSKRNRIKTSAERFSERIIRKSNGTIGKSLFWEKSKIPDTYSIIIRFPKAYSLKEVKNIVAESFIDMPPWSIEYTWMFNVDRYSCAFYDTSTDIAITYGFHPDYPDQLAILVNSYSAVKALTNE